MKYGIILTVTPLATKSDRFPDGMPLINSEVRYIGKKTFKTPDQAEDYLRGRGYSRGSGFWVKAEDGCFKNVEIVPVL